MTATQPLGTFFPDRDQPPLSEEEAAIVDRFHDLYYQRWLKAGADTKNLSWLGYNVRKCPLDLWIYQELIVRTRPDVIVETGTLYGGSALFMANVLDQLGHGRIVSVDIAPKPGLPQHPRIEYMTGSSVDPGVVSRVTGAVGGAPALVILDSDHSAGHVFHEMVAYAPLVQVGGYLIVEDTNVNGHPTWPDYGPGPWEAVDQFLAGSDEFAVDRRCERFMMTLNPRGYLKRERAAGQVRGA